MRSLKKLNQNNLLFFDIETAPLVKELELDTPLFDSWNYKFNRDGSLSNEEVIKSYSKQSGIYPEFAKVVSVVVGKIVKGKIFLIKIDHENEVDILNEFNTILERNLKCKLVGFVNIGFDTPFLFKRMAYNGIKPHDKIDYSGLKPWEVTDIDLGIEWRGTVFERMSLINIATAFGLPSPKEDISGADVGRVYWSEGREGLDRITAYCSRDVVTTINIFRKMIGEEPLEVSTFTPKVEVDTPLIYKLFDGGKYSAAEKKELKEFLEGLEADEREKMYIILKSSTSTARGKKTKLTRAHIKALKDEIDI